MELQLKRIALRPTYTIGRLYLREGGQWKYLCDTLEDTVRDINRNGVFDGNEKKVMHETAIPYGKFNITMFVKSPKYSDFRRYDYARKYDGYMPRLVAVPHFEGILIHPGTTAKDSSGCILVGRNTIVGKLTDSKITWTELMDKYFIPAKRSKEQITIEIV